MKVKLEEKFASISHAGPVDVADFMEIEGEERELILRDAYENRFRHYCLNYDVYSLWF